MKNLALAIVTLAFAGAALAQTGAPASAPATTNAPATTTAEAPKKADKPVTTADATVAKKGKHKHKKN